MENEYTENEFNSFLLGMGILPVEYKEIENEIKQLNLLDRLDKVRWADGSEIVEVDEYILKLRTDYEKLIN